MYGWATCTCSSQRWYAPAMDVLGHPKTTPHPKTHPSPPHPLTPKQPLTPSPQNTPLTPKHTPHPKTDFYHDIHMYMYMCGTLGSDHVSRPHPPSSVCSPPPQCVFTTLQCVLTTPSVCSPPSQCVFTTPQCVFTTPQCVFTTPQCVFTIPQCVLTVC